MLEGDTALMYCSTGEDGGGAGSRHTDGDHREGRQVRLLLIKAALLCQLRSHDEHAASADDVPAMLTVPLSAQAVFHRGDDPHGRLLAGAARVGLPRGCIQCPPSQSSVTLLRVLLR